MLKTPSFFSKNDPKVQESALLATQTRRGEAVGCSRFGLTRKKSHMLRWLRPTVGTKLPP